jgi:lysophospholipase L1-like esterase
MTPTEATGVAAVEPTLPVQPNDGPSDHRRSRMWCRRLWILYLVILHTGLACVLWEPSVIARIEKFVRKSPEHQPEYRGMVTAHVTLASSLPEGSVVFLGDSRMRDLDAAAVASGPVYNFSIGGDTTRGLGARLPRYHRLDRCRLVVLGMGVNDLSHFSDEESLQQYEEVLRCLKDCGVRRVAVCSVLPVDEETYSQANAAWLSGHRVTNGRVVTYNGKLRALCDRHPFARFVDTTGEMTDDAGNLRPGFSADGLHLTGSGSRAWEAALKRSLASEGG